MVSLEVGNTSRKDTHLKSIWISCWHTLTEKRELCSQSFIPCYCFSFFLIHTNNPCDDYRYKKLCGIEYHSVENMRLRKEISKSYGVLHAVQECCISLCISTNATGNNVDLENVFLIGKSDGKAQSVAL